MRTASIAIITCLIVSSGCSAGVSAQGTFLPADEPAYRHLVPLAAHGALVFSPGEFAELAVLPWSDAAVQNIPTRFSGNPGSAAAAWIRDLAMTGSDSGRIRDAVGIRVRPGLRAATQRRLDLLRVQSEADPAIYSYVVVEPFLRVGSWSAVLGFRHDRYYDQDPDGLDSALRLMVRTENAYVRYASKFFSASLGRYPHHWGIYGRPGLILSSNPRPMDQIGFRIGTPTLHIRSSLSELDSITADGRFTGIAGDDSVRVGSERRFLAAHQLSWRPTDRWSFQFTHATLYSGAGASVSLKYLNPMNWALFTADNRPKNDENNGVLGAAATRYGAGYVAHAQVAVDDLDILNRKEPASISGTAWLYLADITGKFDLSAGITAVASRSYNALQNEGKYLYLGRGIGTQYSDFVHADLELKWLEFTGRHGVTIAPRIDLLMQGASDFRRPFPEKDGPGAILSEPVVQTIRPALRIEAGIGRRISLLVNTGVNLNSISKDVEAADIQAPAGGFEPGVPKTQFTGGIHLFVRLSGGRKL